MSRSKRYVCGIYGVILKCTCIYLVWCLSEQEQNDFSLGETIYERLYRKANTKCEEKPQTHLNKELAIETVKFNDLLGDKGDIIKRKLDYEYKMREKTE